MWAIINNNRYFFGSLLLFLILGAILLFNIQKGDMVVFFSDHRSVVGNLFFRYATKMGEIFVYLLLTIAFLFYRFRYAFLFPIAGFLTLGSSLLAKGYFAHPRPVLFFRDAGLLDQLNLIEGIALNKLGSFPSGHTMSAFAMFGLLALILPKKKGVGVLLLIIACLVGFSRVYLVQHFFQDIYVGAILGTLLAMIIYHLQSFLSGHPDRWYNQSLNLFKSKTTKSKRV